MNAVSCQEEVTLTSIFKSQERKMNSTFHIVLGKGCQFLYTASSLIKKKFIHTFKLIFSVEYEQWLIMFRQVKNII